MLTARELIADGHQVILVEKGDMAKESTWAGGGILSPLYPWRYHDSVTKLASWSQSEYADLCDSLKTSTNIDPEFSPSGMLCIATDEIQTAANWAERHAKSIDLAGQDKVRILEPALACSPDKAIWMSDIAHVRNPRLARALVEDIMLMGVSLTINQPVVRLLIDHDKVSGAETPNGVLESDAVVVCTGAWTGQLFNDFTSPPAIRPVKGQMLLFKTNPGTIKRIVLEDNRYIIPRKDGRVLFGSTLEEVGFDKQTTSAAREELYTLATARFPVLKQYSIEKHWAGLRPGAPAGIPYISAHPYLSGLYINAGHFRNGVVLGPASARLCADLVLGRKPILPPEPYAWQAARDE